ncbi:unnamed protein product [Auanema sp. JU1783]|nr:unnamed protein product [Auanema sp. JU1783]
MLENIAAWVLNTYIGEYLEDLETDQLSIDLTLGQLELENVPLKKTALRKLDLPLEVKSGVLGKLTLTIPITQIRTKPWTLKLSDVLIVLGPLPTSRKYDVEAVEEVEQQRKEQMLLELEQSHKSSLLQMMGMKKSENEYSWWGASLVAAVLHNIQLILDNVHIRYEDNLTLPNSRGFSCGVRIQKVIMETTNSAWKPGFVEPEEGLNIFKKLVLTGFSIYWDSDEQIRENEYTPSELKEALASETALSSFIIEPCSMELVMEKNSSKFPLKESEPRFKLFLKPNKTICNLTRSQMIELRVLNREWARFERARQHRKWRPSSSISRSTAKEWWQFAFGRVTDEKLTDHSRKTWQYALNRARLMNAYCRAYRRRLLGLVHNPNAPDSVADPATSNAAGTGSVDDKAIMKQIERDAQYTYNDIQLLREIVYKRLQHEHEQRTPPEPLEEVFESVETPVEEIPKAPGKYEGTGIYGWFSSFFGASKTNEIIEEKLPGIEKLDLSDLKNIPKSFNLKDMEDEFLDVLHESWDDSTLLRKDNLLAEILLQMEQITLRFIDSSIISGVEQRRVLAMQLNKVSSRVELSPRHSTFSVQLSVDDMSIQRLRTGHAPSSKNSTNKGEDESSMFNLAETTKILLAIGRKDSKTLKSDPIFRMQYRRSEKKFTVKHVIEGCLKPISVIYEENALAGLSTLFADDPLVFKSDVSFDNTETYKLESHILANFHIPEVTMEVRYKGSSSSNLPEWEPGDSLVCFDVNDVLLGVNSEDRYMSRLKINVGYLECIDLANNKSRLLVSGKKLHKKTDSLSNSCPSLNQIPRVELGGAHSLPTSTFLDNMPEQNFNNGKKISFLENDTYREIEILVTLIDSRHAQFDSYKSNCIIEAKLDDLSLKMNRTTVTALMDLAGLLGTDEKNNAPMPEDIESVLDTYVIRSSLETKMLKINMCYPGNKTQLGQILLSNPKFVTTMTLNQPQETMTVDISMLGMKIDDFTPNYSDLYRERVFFHDSASRPSPMQIHIVKYLGENRIRDCDLSLDLSVPQTMNFFYVHTHRFFSDFTDFWLQFLELQDQIIKSRKENVVEGGRAKVLLDLSILSPTTIILPLNQCSDQVLILESTGLRFTNSFKKLSSIEHIFMNNFIETDHGFDKEVDCTLDCGNVIMKNVCAFEGRRFGSNHKKFDTRHARLVGRHFFIKNEFWASKKNIFSKAFDFVFDVFRNLDGVFSHNAPDLTVLSSIHDMTWYVTTDFYMLFRGILEKNIADPRHIVPETVPIQILQKPEVGCEVNCDFNYSTLSFRMLFENVQLELLAPKKVTPSVLFGNEYQDFGRMELRNAQVSFDVFIDGQNEFDLICQSTKLIDTRQKVNDEKNLHPVILEPRDPSCMDDTSLMAEAHLMIKKDEPPIITLVLMNARVILLPDWLNDAKEFILLTSNFVPKYSDDPSRYRHCMRGVVDRTNLGCVHFNHEQTFSVKITLRDSDLYVLEAPSKVNSLALVISTTALLNMNDANGELNANLEVQSVTVGWCSMQEEEISMTSCSNKFAIGISLGVDHKLHQNNGLPEIFFRKHVLEVGVRGLIGRMSFKDIKVVMTILDSFKKSLNDYTVKSLIPVVRIVDPSKVLCLERIVVRADHMDVWILDDYQGSAIPFLRLSFSNFEVDHKSDKVEAKLSFSTDYFNQRVFGWEPLIEKWIITRFLSKKKDKTHKIELIAESRTPLDINITEQLVQQMMQMSARWPSIQSSLEKEEYRNSFMKTRTDHLPYLFKNETGSEVKFTTEVADVLASRNEHRKTNARWICVPKNKEQTFEFPTKLLLYSQNEREPPRQLIIRVTGWDEISQVNVDSCGTYFRVVKADNPGSPNARLVIKVTMEKDGKKVVAVRSSLQVHNHFPHPIDIYVDKISNPILTVGLSESLPIPLEFAHNSFTVKPKCGQEKKAKAEISWRGIRKAGQSINTTQRLDGVSKDSNWLCTMVRRDYYPEDENLPGHSVYIVAPLTIQNLLPIDVEIRMSDQTFAIRAGKQLQITTVDITATLSFNICTDRLKTSQSIQISKSSISSGKQLQIYLQDAENRHLSMYVNLQIGLGGSLSMSLWVTYWIVNKSGIPLVIKQEGATSESSGQGDEHEKAKDKHPLMFSFSDPSCPHQCAVRVGKSFVTEPGYTPLFGRKFPLIPGVQAIKLKLVHDNLPTLYYNVGVEVRPGTGRYKDTQVVLLTSRYLINNQSSYDISVSHSGDGLDKSPVSNCVDISAQSSIVWNEKVQKEFIRVKRSDVKYWSCPFRIDRIGSFHVTMRNEDETPRFIRVEIILSSAAFCVTFTDAEYYPSPIRIDNQSDVPVLYQQFSDCLISSHFRTICKARSHVDYAWDDIYGQKLIVLQLYENKSHPYDPARPGVDERALVYENNAYLQLVSSFKRSSNPRTEECELVLETLTKGKVTLNKQNRVDANYGNQLWKLCDDGYIENIGLQRRYNERKVLDVLENGDYQLMMKTVDPARENYQKWMFKPSGQICLKSRPDLIVTAKRTEVCLSKNDPTSEINEEHIPVSQVWKISRQRPGSGVLEVECLHSGPTLVVRITDREKRRAPVRSSAKQTPDICELSISMKSGIGISIINGLYEEILYGRLSLIEACAQIHNESYSLHASIGHIQVDNQLNGAEKVPLIYYQTLNSEDLEAEQTRDLPAGVPSAHSPALKLEMNCTPKKNYDAFDCFRLKFCNVNVNLDELILWKLIQFVQASDVSSSVQQKALNLPPNLEIERPDPLKTRRWYFGTLELVMGQIALSVTTVSKSSLPMELQNLKEQFNIKLVSFENATVALPDFRQSHYFETSTFLLESLQKFYFAELKKQTINIIVTLDAFGNPLGLVTDLKDCFQGLFIEGDVQRFLAGLGYGVSNSVSKMASSMASGVGSFTFDQDHELRRRNMIRSQSVSSTPLTHLYSGVKGLGMGVFGGVTAILTNTIAESRKSGYAKGAFIGITTGAVDTVTKPVQGLFDLVEGTATAMKELAGSTASGSRRSVVLGKIRPPRVCRDLFHLLPPYNLKLANCQMEMLRINGYSMKERLLDVETSLEQVEGVSRIVRYYALVSTKQCYVCKQINNESSNVIHCIPYKYLRSVKPFVEKKMNCALIDVRLDNTESRNDKPVQIWCSSEMVARKLADKIMRAKHEYDHSKRTLIENTFSYPI